MPIWSFYFILLKTKMYLCIIYKIQTVFLCPTLDCSYHSIRLFRTLSHFLCYPSEFIMGRWKGSCNHSTTISSGEIWRSGRITQIRHSVSDKDGGSVEDPIEHDEFHLLFIQMILSSLWKTRLLKTMYYILLFFSEQLDPPADPVITNEVGINFFYFSKVIFFSF